MRVSVLLGWLVRTVMVGDDDNDGGGFVYFASSSWSPRARRDDSIPQSAVYGQVLLLFVCCELSCFFLFFLVSDVTIVEQCC